MDKLERFAEYINKDKIVTLINTYEDLFSYIKDNNHSKREKVERYIDIISAADAQINDMAYYITHQALEDIFEPYWELEKNILDIPEDKKELLFYYMANEIDMTKEEVINIIAG